MIKRYKRMDAQTKRFTVIENLKKELFSNISLLMMKTDKAALLNTDAAKKAKSYYKGGYEDSSNIPYDAIAPLVLFFIPSSSGSWELSTEFIMEALKSGELVTFDAASNTHSLSPVHQNLLKLVKEIKRFKHAADLTDTREDKFREKYVQVIRAKQPIITIKNTDLISTFANYNTQMNIVALSKAIIDALEGNNNSLSNLQLLPASPLEEEKKQMEKEIVSEQDVRNYFNMPEPPVISNFAIDTDDWEN